MEHGRQYVVSIRDRANVASNISMSESGYLKGCVFYTELERHQLLKEQTLENAMEGALQSEEFLVYLQPKIRLSDGRAVGAEALVRWKSEEYGLIPPDEFIPLFEKNGFITKLDQFVWDRACAALQSWDEKGYPAISVSVNVSRADIYNADIADILIKTVRKYRLPPSRLHLEITESAYTENPKQIIDTVGRLRELGFVIEMDDFGSGYSSLNMLNQMPLDVLKLDMKFIQVETAKPVNQGILRFIMGLARWMNLSVVAEGVETREQLVRLREIGCDYVQGYYFAKPMPCGEFEALLNERGVALKEEKTDSAWTMGKRVTKMLLVADEDAEYRAQVRKRLDGRYQVVEAADGDTALACMANCEYKLAAVILSMTLKNPDGFSMLEVLQREKTEPS